jgi:hypothetical protein
MFRFQTVAAVFLMAIPAVAGGNMILTIGKAEASSDPAATSAFMLVRPDGCGDPENVKITAVAEGLINGQRQSVPVTVVPLSKRGTFAVRRTWPTEGKWILHLHGSYGNLQSTALVPITADGFDRAGIRQLRGKAAAADVDAALRAD